VEGAAVKQEDGSVGTWKQLTDTSGQLVDVNLDQALFLQQVGPDTTDIYFRAPGDGVYPLSVKETPQEIHQKLTLPLKR
jgi:hypothetical protein